MLLDALSIKFVKTVSKTELPMAEANFMQVGCWDSCWFQCIFW